jgi:chaperone LolA
MVSVSIMVLNQWMAMAAQQPVAAITTVDELLQAVHQAESAITTMTFNFFQSVAIGATGEKQSMSGTAYFKKPQNLRIENIRPEKNLFVSDGATAWYYAPAQKQVMKSNGAAMTQGSAGAVASILQFTRSADDLKEKYTMRFRGKEKSSYVLALEPKNISRAEQFQMTIWFNEHDFLPSKTTLVVQTMTSTTTINRVKTNMPLSDALFTFKTPPGVQEIDMQ